ncbi:inheritance of peroxisomes protein 1-domain-containing protein [Xylariales sp. PMI_506]|nr:inheritance of peroxisomes protein 1-domain-containing protein [Xylariales sp. PMI_506]
MESPNLIIEPMPPPRRVATEPTVFPTPRRSLSVSSLCTGPPAGSRDAETSIETLYSHPSVKIIAFYTSQRYSLDNSNLLEEPKPGSLAASSQLERTIAVGPFRIYRAPGSVAFLNCGSALQPILPKSQCWCINEANNQFVLQIRRPQYWRIEIPLASPEDVHRALVLRDVFDKILLFEKTECPFQRNFTVKLPEGPRTPVKKIPWTPIGKNLVAAPFASGHSPPYAPRALTVAKKSPSATSNRLPVKEVLAFSAERPQRTNLVEPKQRNSFIFSDGDSVPSPQNKKLSGKRPIDTRTAIISTSVFEELPPEPVLKTAGSNVDVETQKLDQEAVDIVTLTAPKRVVNFREQVQSQGCDTLIHPAAGEIREETKKRDLDARTLEHGQNLRSLDTISQQVDYVPDTDSSHSGFDCEGTKASGFIKPSPPSAIKDVQTSTSYNDLHHSDKQRTNDSLQFPGDTRHKEIMDKVAVKDPEYPGTRLFEGAGSVGAVNLKKKRMSRMLAGRSVTLPPRLSLVTSSQPKTIQQFQTEQLPAVQTTLKVTEEPVVVSPVGSVDSFHSVESWHSPITPLPPSPTSTSTSPPTFPCPHDNIVLPAELQPRVKDSSGEALTPNTEATIIPCSAGATICTLSPSSPIIRSTPSEEMRDATMPVRELEQSSSYSSPVLEHSGMRQRTKSNNLSISKRALSPLPPAANLFSPPLRRRPSSRFEVVRKLPSAIIHKTVEILFSPPSHLVNLMLQVAAKIAAGEWRGLVLGFGEGGEKIPVQWDYSDGDLSSWEDEDDYTFSMGRFIRRKSTNESVFRVETNASSDQTNETWEVN